MARPTPRTHGTRPTGGTRPYQPTTRRVVRPPHRTRDHRYARPSYRYVRNHPAALRPVPTARWYRPYYTRWYVHPWYRWTHSTTVVVNFGFDCYAWSPWWSPPARAGWMWVPGVWVGASWTPGHWAPVRTAPVGYVYVPGYWDQDVYVEGWYRPAEREQGDWSWIEGYYLDDGTFVRGHWRPTKPGPDGYLWEPGFWDGETWVDGFWRPEYRSAYTWVSSYYDADGIYHGGYWAPLEERAGEVWVPGWFDGNQWVEGYWVPEAEYESTDVSSWEPAAGWDDGWEVEGFGDGAIVAGDGSDTAAPAPAPAPASVAPVPEGSPLGIPVEVDVEDAP